MKIVVVGGSGWLGSHLVQALTGKHDVIVIDPKEPLIPFGPEIEHIQQPVACLLIDPHPVLDADVVVSLPGQLGSVNSVENPLGNVIEGNMPQLTLLKVLADNGLTPTVVFPSSHLVYKDPPRCVYTANKIAIEAYLRIYSRAYGIPYVILRIATGYGPHQERSSAVNFFIRRALEGKTIPVYKGVQNDRLAIVYIDDMVNALVLACERENYRYHVYPVFSSQPRIIDIAGAVTDVLGGEIELTETPDLVKSVGSGDLLITDIGPPGWIPGVGLRDGIRKTAQWMQSVWTDRGS